jgi:hypothetical protein
MTETDDATAAQPHFYSGVINDPSHPIYQPCSSCAPRADYVGSTYDARGTFWAGVVEQLGSPDAAAMWRPSVTWDGWPSPTDGRQLLRGDCVGGKSNKGKSVGSRKL